ncbi:MAG: hypothetical protein IJ365_06630 [Clostridia bacterium]|nr:hypothetical protein [Clostridia bacterium]
MKKFLICTLVLMSVTLCGICAHADNGILRSADMPALPDTVDTYGASLASYDGDIAEDIVKAWSNLDATINVSKYKIRSSELGEIYWDVYFNNPTYYYVGGQVQWYETLSGFVTEIVPQYTDTDKSKIDAYMQELRAATDEILLYTDDAMSDFEKVMAVHDYMVLNYKYDETLENHSITIMTTKTGVCQAYAYAFKHVMNELDIDCAYVSSEQMNHAWNLVKIDGKWYHLDMTWDDPVTDRFGQVSHTYALLSTKCITSMAKPHYDFNLAPLTADSDKYDNAPWHSGVGSVIFAEGNTYWFDGDDLMCSDGSEIHDDIINKNRWFISDYYYLNGVYAGLAYYDGKLYYNSDKAIYSYDIKTKNKEIVKKDIGICGLFVNKNTLYYTKSTTYTVEIDGKTYTGIRFEYGGEIELGDFFVGDCYRDEQQVVTRICNTSDSPVFVVAFDGKKAQTELCEQQGACTVTFDMADKTDIFIWDANLRPIASKRTVE